LQQNNFQIQRKLTNRFKNRLITAKTSDKEPITTKKCWKLTTLHGTQVISIHVKWSRVHSESTNLNCN